MLKSVPGVNEINAFGGYFKQYQVIVVPERLLKHGLSVDQVYTAIGKNNQNVGGNVIEKYADQYIVRGVGLIKNTDDIENIVLKSSGGTPTFLKDVAEVRIGEAVRQGAAMINGQEEAVGGIVMMLRGENSREVVERVKKKVREINENNVLPEGISIRALLRPIRHCPGQCGHGHQGPGGRRPAGADRSLSVAAQFSGLRWSCCSPCPFPCYPPLSS